MLTIGRQPAEHEAPLPPWRPSWGARMLQGRPIVRTRSQVRVLRRRRRWDRVSWWFSLLLVVPLVLITADRLFGLSPVDDSPGARAAPVRTVAFRVTDVADGKPLVGAEVRAGSETATSDENGAASLSLPAEPVYVTVSLGGYESVYGRADRSIDRQQAVALRALPEAAPEPAVPAEGGDQVATTGTPDGGAGAHDAPASTPTESVAAPVAGQISGRVKTEDGNPIKDAEVTAGSVRIRTKRDGTFNLTGAPNSGDLLVSATGYADKRLALPVSAPVEVALARFEVKAVYLSGRNAGNADVVDRLIKLADDTEINAIVVDIKENYVWYDTGVRFFQDANAVDATYDPRELVKRLHEHGIYAIARSVVFNDPIVAQNRPDLAVKNDNGGVWKGADGGAWVNPFNQKLWQPNIDLAVEAAQMGFDEIQYDYIRFPSDGDLTTADFGPNYNEEGRVAAIVDFLKQSKKALEPTGAKLAADVFGIIAIYPDDQGIGQRLADIAPVVDYVCPMVYPSHFDPTSIDVGGDPNDHPYQTVQLSLDLAKAKMPGLELKLRPWLQDFDLGRNYTADDVRAQVKASDEAGTSGWMLWNAANEYTDDALESGS
jgi:hypothetical protein